ncbi:choline kinase [Geosmithia morbida]|uniref:Choline kinase n=1 Tax=Geosmithia morbida TaxID=1094350 RepID=A0A9P4YXP0_9HYPO|nr:choline kinase [Geosmithia morbida]KAF4124407.1 choline kinase [Geosmithia morbida]
MPTSGAASNGSGVAEQQQQQHQPLRSALKNEDDADKALSANGSSKAVQISEPATESSFDDDVSVRQFRAAHGRRLSGKPSPSLRPADEPGYPSREHSHRQQYYGEKLLAQVGEWLEWEKKKISNRKKKSRPHPTSGSSQPHDPPPTSSDSTAPPRRPRSDSLDSQSSHISLEKLQQILEDSMSSMGLGSAAHLSSKVSRSRRKRMGSLQRAASSDTDYHDGDAIVPDCDVWLDNSKTLAYAAGTPSDTGDDDRSQRDYEAWVAFKNEILRAAHTLRLKGWRRVPLETGETMDVQRLSGALTNAVYVLTPPADIPHQEGKPRPQKVLLRIYGPQVENLIDRENELKVLQRLARKKIGPRLLGTFRNGRFEQFFNASPLTPSDLRDPEVSRQIAKRMRELHQGIELLPQEREAGPCVWKNWDQWLDNVGSIVPALDKQFEAAAADGSGQRRDSATSSWKANGYVCGVPWTQFKDVVHRYRAHLDNYYKDRGGLNESLLFAHNDTQYGNILRFQPDDEKSPLLQPANKHKQLIVIDFEYAGANMLGQEFANHFTEWTYNYHDVKTPWACTPAGYPTLEEQRRFVKAYIEHRPHFHPTGGSTPRLAPQDSNTTTPGAATPAQQPQPPQVQHTTSSSSIVDFMLDSRAPPGGWGAVEKAEEEKTEKEIRQLLDETRMWRPANSAMWVAWGVVQARIDEVTDDDDKDDGEAPTDEFDYLSYAQDRAAFFWGDMVQMGLVKPEELPESLRAKLKIVDH